MVTLVINIYYMKSSLENTYTYVRKIARNNQILFQRIFDTISRNQITTFLHHTSITQIQLVQHLCDACKLWDNLPVSNGGSTATNDRNGRDRDGHILLFFGQWLQNCWHAPSTCRMRTMLSWVDTSFLFMLFLLRTRNTCSKNCKSFLNSNVSN